MSLKSPLILSLVCLLVNHVPLEPYRGSQLLVPPHGRSKMEVLQTALRLRLALCMATSKASCCAARMAVCTSSGRAVRSRDLSASNMISVYQIRPIVAPYYKAQSHSVAPGLRGRRAVTRRQSNPSNRASNCAFDSRITPSLILGHANLPSSSRL